MTGSFLVLIVTPIVAIIALACWMGLVFWADAHPRWTARSAAPGTQSPGESPILAGDLAGDELEPSHQDTKAA